MRDLAWQELYQQVQRPDRRAVRVSRLPHRAAGQRQHHGREGHHRRHGQQDDGLGRDRQAQSARMAARRPQQLTRRTTACIPAATTLFTTAPPEPPGRNRAGPPRRRSCRGRCRTRRRPAANALRDRLWKGWILPASDADTWFAAGSAAYHASAAVRRLREGARSARASRTAA